MGGPFSDAGADRGSNGYVTFLVIIALSGWTLASYDFNLLVVAFPDIAKDLHLTASFVGLLGFIIYAAMFGITLFAGYGMDLLGRKKMWMWCLCGAAAFTGLTYFVQNYWQLAVVRALASGFATSELAISLTLVKEPLQKPLASDRDIMRSGG
jgi:MFS family permease